MFTEHELQTAAQIAAQMDKCAGFFDPHQFDSYSLGMPALKPWAPPTPTFGSAFKHMFTGAGRNLGTAAQTLLTGKNNPGVAENLLRNTGLLVAHPTDPARFRALFSLKNVTDPFRRAMPEFRQDWRQTGEFGGMVGKELGERYNILKDVFMAPPHF